MSKVFVIGLDGATFDLIHPFIAQGYLPNLQSLISKGAWSELSSTVPPVTASAWNSFMTGKNPGGHGLFDFMQRRKNSYDLAPVSSFDRDGKAVWQVAGDAGKQSIILGVPVTYPPTPVNGLMVTGMLTPRGAPDYTYPAELKNEIAQAIGEYVVYSDEVYSKGRGEIFLKALHYSIQQRAKTAAYLLHKYDWDLGVLVFPETDTVCHGLWWAYDASHHQHKQEGMQQRASLQNGILEIYQDIDAYIGELVASLPADTTIFVMSDHGHGPLRNFLYVNNFLKQRGYLKIKNAPASQLKNIAFRAGLTPRTAYGVLLNLGLGKLRRTMDKRRSGRGVLKRFFLSLNDVDWANTRAYSIGYIGEVHVNLKGREPQGIVEPGAQYEQLRDELICDLRALKLPDGAPLVEHIWKKEEIYSGVHLPEAPDILFLPKNLETIAFGDFEFGSNKILEPSYGVSSSHRMNGIFIAAGPTIRPNAPITQSPSLIDLAPTILHAMQLPVPPDMDGRVLNEIFADARAVEYGGSAVLARAAGEGYSEQEEDEVIERLKDLGYIS
ncbi:MAG: alkaline phosphatase family protein [Chloroflexi bacterium]|nr:alkaline phosphatase family protein [Chloroflexota bacterium]